MSLIGKTVEEQMWNFFMERVSNAYGVASLMGHWYAESGLKPTNLQNSFEGKLGYTDETYTKAVDGGSYSNFVRDSAGYGLAQWTYWSRKQNMLDFAKARGCSIGDTEMQFEFGYQELSTGYKGVLAIMKSAKSVREASDVLLTQYERPADQSETVKARRAEYGQKYYEKYAGGSKMSNSKLVNYTKISPHKNSPRNHAIDTVSIHCVVGQLSVETIGNVFQSKEASANYGIGSDGRIGMYVEEKDRSWCTSSASNDNRAITIECASDTSEPYAINDKVYASLINLLVDICQRNGIKELKWRADKNLIGQVDKQNMTVHRWFANKSCPGEYLYSRHGQIAAEVNKRLGVVSSEVQNAGSTAGAFPAVPFQVQVLIPDLNYRSEPSMAGIVKGKTGKGMFTIIQVSNGWGKLKSGAGWILLENPSYCTIKGNVSSISVASQPATETRKSVEEIAKEVIRGQWGNGTDRKKRLEAAGYNFSQVQAAVNRLL